MNFAHGRTILWLRWRLACNQINKLSWVNRILLWLVVVGSAIGGVASFLLAISLGGWILPAEWPAWMVLVWDGLILAFLMSWIIGVLTDLQRTEPLSLDKFLHLPVSPRGVFLLNYFNSLISLSSVAFAPLMFGLSVALVQRYGGWMAAGVALVAVFFLMVTALTFQFRGWLALLMQDKRRRRTIVTVVTLFVILMSQIPNLLDLTVFRGRERENKLARAAERTERDELQRQISNGAVTSEEAERRLAELDQRRAARERARLEQILGWTHQANRWIPFLWLASGIDSLAQHQAWPAAAAFGGMLALASISLWRSYRSTLRLYGGAERRAIRNMPGSPPTELPRGPAEPVAWKTNWVESPLWGLNEQQTAVAWMTLRNISRAPEAKLAILAPIFAVLLLGSLMIFRTTEPLAPVFRPLTAMGLGFFAMVGVSQLIQNQFGFDRDGFRALLLGPIPERDILIGKNTATAPIALGLALAALIAQQIALPMPLSHFVASLFQLGTIYLVACLVGNLMSILTPMAVASGSLKPANYKFATLLLQFILFFLAPLGMLPALLPWGLELLLSKSGILGNIPIYLLGAGMYFVALAAAYRGLIRWQADLFRERKWKILETITDVGT